MHTYIHTYIHTFWSHTYDQELQRQSCKKFITPRVAWCVLKFFFSTLKKCSSLLHRYNAGVVVVNLDWPLKLRRVAEHGPRVRFLKY
jgi:hypothetical protein